MPRVGRQIAVFIETQSGYGRALLDGIGDFVNRHDDWEIYVPGWAWERKLDIDTMRDSDLAGVLVRPSQSEHADEISTLGCPVVNLKPEYDGQFLYRVGPDWDRVAEVAFDHLHERGMEHFGFFGDDQRYARLRMEPFAQVLERAGHRLHRLLLAGWGPDVGEGSQRELAVVGEWLQGLPKPIGILCSNDLTGQRVSEAAAARGLQVPDQVALLGIHNDTTICNLSNPPLSSIETNGRRIGYEAAALLERIISDQTPAPHVIRVPPQGVEWRRSTDVYAFADPSVAAAARFIRLHACDPVGVDEVAEHVGISRRSLELRFNRSVGRTPGQEITRRQVQRARQLLIETDWSLNIVAHRAGYRDAVRLSKAFKREVGQPPSQFRQAWSLGQPPES